MTSWPALAPARRPRRRSSPPAAPSERPPAPTPRCLMCRGRGRAPAAAAAATAARLGAQHPPTSLGMARFDGAPLMAVSRA
eukprot:366251-Chlamydomonas_euryale.AAC.6